MITKFPEKKNERRHLIQDCNSEKLNLRAQLLIVYLNTV